MTENETFIEPDIHKNRLRQLATWIKLNPNSTLFTIVFIIGFLIRIVLALRALGIYHPDEIFQSLEMAHLIVFDSGYTPPEFTKENPVIPSYAASRSWLFPLFFAAIMRFGEFIGLDYHNQTLPLIRFVLAVNSALLIPVSRKFVTQLTKNDTAGVLSAAFVAFWWRLIELTIRPLSNTFFLPMLFFGLYRMLVVMETKKISNKDHLIIAVFVGLSTYIRLDLGIIVFALFITTFHISQIRQYFEFLLDGIIGWLIGIIVDYNYYERSIDLTNFSEYREFVTVPVNWITFALDHGDIFGVSDRQYYYNELLVADGLSIFSLLSLVVFISVSIKITIKFKMKSNFEVKPIEFAYIRLCAITLISWLISSSVWDKETHKEIRFNTSGLVLLLFTIAVAMTWFIEYADEAFENDVKSIAIKFPKIGFIKNQQWRRLFLILIVTLMLASQSINYQEDRGYVESFDDVNLALTYVGQQSDVTGVILVGLWFLAGSYTYLHLDSNVTIQYVNLKEGDQIAFHIAEIVLETLFQTWEEGNYLILPLYQVTTNQFINRTEFEELLNLYNFSLEKDIEGRTEVWVRS